MHAHAGRAAILLMLALLGTIAGNRAVHATPAAAGATPPPLWQPPEPQAVLTPADGPFLHYELRDPGTQTVTVVEVDRYETTLLINGEPARDWYSQLADPAHIKTLLEQAQTGPLRDHYAPLGTVPAIQQTLVYTQDQQVRTITFDATSHTPAPPAVWDLVAALRRIGELPPLTGTPSGPRLPPTITFQTAMEEYALQIDPQGIARVYEYHKFRGARRLTPAELAAIRKQVATMHFFDLDPFYTFRDPPGGIVDADFLGVLVTQAGQSKLVSSRGGSGPPAFTHLLDTLYGLADEIARQCQRADSGDPMIKYELHNGDRDWFMQIDSNGGIYRNTIDSGEAPMAYIDAKSLHALLSHFHQAQFDKLNASYSGTTSLDPITYGYVDVSFSADRPYNDVRATPGAHVPAGYQTILEDLATIYTQAYQAEQRAIVGGACADYIHLNT
ncbi:MAG: hypothetical protein M3Z04_20585, partial [Chloroflexota bacterium]|nr:hypothetical protein [Chloroflexota bacterium]